MGSANCSAAAWLRPLPRGGNVEAMLVYERPEPEALRIIDSLGPENARLPESLLLASNVEPAPPRWPATPFVVRSIRILEAGTLAAQLRSDPPSGWTFEVEIGGQAIALDRVSDGGWVGPTPELLPVGQTAFARYRLAAADGATQVSGRRWVDDLRFLRESGPVRRLPQALDMLRRPGTDREDLALVQELTRLAHDLIHDVRAFSDPSGIQTPRRPRANLNGATPVDPTRLIRSLRDVAVPEAHPLHPGQTMPSLSGIFRALFHTPDDESGEHEVGPDEEDPASADENGSSLAWPDPRAPSEPAPVALRNRERFERHLDRFLVDLRSETFRERATAGQLLQAAAYPFAATRLGLERGWTDAQRARGWVLETARILLYGEASGSVSLLHHVRQRYESAGAAAVFDRSAGEGALWVTMVAGLAAIRWRKPKDALQHAILLRDVWNNSDLRPSINAAHLDSLIRRHRAADAVSAFRELAAPAVAGLDAVAAALAALGVGDLLELQAATRRPVGAGELLWGPKERLGAYS